MPSSPIARRRLGRLLVLFAAVPLSAVWAGEAKPTLPDPAAVERGKPAYERYCLSCHGERGDGHGVSAPFLDPKPRDFTRGVFKWRSTPLGTLPLDADLFRTIRRGLYNTNMPRWSALTDDQIRDVIAYVEHFAPQFSTEPRGTPIVIPPEPPETPESEARGKQIFAEMGCASCHGATGKGDGAAANWPGLGDDWGNPIRPADFASGRLKGAREPADIYRIFMTGLSGTPMPSFVDSLTPEKAWDLAHFIQSLARP